MMSMRAVKLFIAIGFGLFAAPASAVDVVLVTAANWTAEDGALLDATEFLKQACDGQLACDIGRVPFSAMFGDPSPGVPKRLDVKYDCFGTGGIENREMTFYEVTATGAVDVSFGCGAL